MEGIVRKGQRTGCVIPREILGHNLELVLNGDKGFLNERLYNGKFLGPEDPATGLAKGWCSYPINDLKGMKLRLLPGLGMRGKEGQIIENYSGKKDFGIMQANVQVRAGEELEINIWARAQDAPVMLQAGLKPLGNCGVYAAGLVLIDCPYWKEYHILLKISRDDNNSVFFCTLEGNGCVCIDQIHLVEKGAGVLNPKALYAIKELNPPVLRFPGGCITTAYHWINGTGPSYTRPVGHDPVFKDHINYDFGTDEYLALCVELGITPHITLNTSTGTPDEAYEWAVYCRDWFTTRKIEPLKMFWQIGNEQYGAWEIGHMTAEMYVEVLKSFASRVKAGYPKAIIIGLGAEYGDGFVMGESYPWRSIVLEHAGDFADIFTYQCYHTAGFSENKKSQLDSIEGAVGSIRSILQRIIADLDKCGLQHAKAGLTEWNMWYHAAHHDNNRFYEPYDVQHGIYAASVIHILAGLSPRIGVANFYNLINVMGIIRSNGGEAERSVLFDIFKLYGNTLPGERIELDLRIPSIGQGSAVIDALCIESKSKSRLFFINRSMDQVVTLELQGFNGLKVMEYFRGLSVEGVFTREDGNTLMNCELLLYPMSIVCIEEQ